MFLCQMEAIVFIILQTFFTAPCTVLKIGDNPRLFPSFQSCHRNIWSGDVLRPIVRVVQAKIFDGL